MAVISLLALFIAGCEKSKEEPSPSISTITASELIPKLFVERKDIALSADNEKAEKELWNKIAQSKQIKYLPAIVTDNWEGDWIKCQSRLKEIAKNNNYDDASLESCLVSLHAYGPKKIYSLPEAVYLSGKGEDAMWIVVLRWEDYHTSGDSKTIVLSHIAVTSIRIKDLKRMATVSCN